MPVQIVDLASFTSSASTGITTAMEVRQNRVNGAQTRASKPQVNGNGSTSAAGDPNLRSQEASLSEPLDNLVKVSVILLRQAVDLVNESLCEDGQLMMESKFIPGSTIGKHLRHATDHFSLLLDSLHTESRQEGSTDAKTPRRENDTQAELELSYDVRARGTPMETSRLAAREALETCITRLRNVATNVERDRVVKLTAVTPSIETFKTSFGRELWFAALHAVHHWSMVRVIAGELGIRLEDSFGVAPSTLVYHGSEGPLGKAKI